MLYQERFPKGTEVRIVNRRELANFRNTWKYHNPISEGQLEFAGRSTTVASVSFYHGGDVLYQLVDIPGTWHELCLEAL
jgi:hypothetical protein